MTDQKDSVAKVAEGVQEVVLDENGKPLSKNALKKLQKEQEKARKKAEFAAANAAKQAAQESPDYSTDRYGRLPLNQSQKRERRQRVKIHDLNGMEGKTVLLRARVHTTRAKGKQCFMVLRQRSDTVQAVLAVDQDKISKQMVKFAGGIKTETIVLVEAVVVKAFQEVKTCTISLYELQVERIHTESEVAVDMLPFSVEDAQRPEAEDDQVPEDGSKFVKVLLDTRLNNRVIDLRSITNQAIFTIQSKVGQLFRDLLCNEGFTEIHTPKIISAASEGGANVFRVSYFKSDAFLAQSPQLYKQMMICADFERVFEIAPVFRAENSFTHRHMTEFIGLDLEMAFEEHYHEVLDLFDKLFVGIFKGLKQQCSKEMETIKLQYPFDDFEFLEPTLRLKFKDGIAMLREAGVQVGDYEDLR